MHNSNPGHFLFSIPLFESDRQQEVIRELSALRRYLRKEQRQLETQLDQTDQQESHYTPPNRYHHSHTQTAELICVPRFNMLSSFSSQLKDVTFRDPIRRALSIQVQFHLIHPQMHLRWRHNTNSVLLNGNFDSPLICEEARSCCELMKVTRVKLAIS